MIRPININLNAAHPELPLVEATTFTGAPSSVFIRGVPRAVGNWSITAVNVAVTFPDNSTTTRAAVESAEGVWVATIPGTATSGRTVAGFRILADGIDENGAAVTGYVLGFADFAVLSFFPVPAPGETFFYLRYFDTMPTAAKKMDVTTIDGVLKFYNGSAWEPFAAPPTLDDAVTPTSANGVRSSGIWSAIWGALAALPAGFSSLYDWCVAQLTGKLGNTGNQVLNGNLAVYSTISDIAVYHGSYIQRLSNGVTTQFAFPAKSGTFALAAGAEHSGNLAALDADGNPTDSQIPAANVAVKGNIPYSLVTKTISNGAVSLDDRAINAVAVSSSLASLTVNFPTATSGKVRDFGLRVEIGTGSAALAAPALVPIAPTGETIKIENNAAEIPALADGTATAKGVTLLYFSETAPGVFVVKGEQVEEVA